MLQSLEKRIQDLNIEIGVDKYINEYESIKTKINKKEKLIKNLEKKFLNMSSNKDKNKDIPFDKIIYMMQNIYDEAENTDNLEKLIELYENAYQLNSMASQKAKESNIKIIKIN